MFWLKNHWETKVRTLGFSFSRDTLPTASAQQKTHIYIQTTHNHTHHNTHTHAKRQVKQWREKVKECSDPIWSYFLYTYTYKWTKQRGKQQIGKEITLHKEEEEAKEESKNAKQNSEGKVHHCEKKNKNRYLHVIYYIKREKLCKKMWEETRRRRRRSKCTSTEMSERLWN